MAFHDRGGPYDRTKGAKRVVAVDVTGLPVGALVVPASTDENRASERMLEHLGRQGVTGRLELVLVDRGVSAAAARTLGRHHDMVVETAATADLFASPSHPYTQALLSASPQVDRRRSRARLSQRIVLAGDPPSPADPASGCRFHTRCRFATAICSSDQPPTVETGPGHVAMCHHTEQAVMDIASPRHQLAER